MSEQKMNENERLEQELNDMAAEVPEMPASFREGWRRAIREEASEKPIRAEIRENRETNINRSQETTKHEPGKHAFILKTRRWAGILSVAAAMVFLIGGTFATRGALSPRLRKNTDVLMQESGQLQNEEIAWGMDTELQQDAREQIRTESILSDNLADSARGISFETSLGVQETHFPMIISEDAEMEASNPKEGAALFETNAGEEETGLEESADTAGAAEEAAEAVASMKTREVEKLSSEEDGTNTAAEAKTPGFWTEAGWFMEDMGAFLKAALPYLIGAAAVAFVVLLLRKSRKH